MPLQYKLEEGGREGGRGLGITVLAVTYFIISEEECKESDNCPTFQERVESVVETDFH